MLRYAVVFSSVASLHALIAGVGPSPMPRVAAVRMPALVAQPRTQIAMQEALFAAPQAGYDGAVAAGAKKASMPAAKIFKLGLISGAHIGFGAFLMLSVGGACPGLAATNPGLKMIISGAFGLPFGLFMTIMSGAELFTGNTALVTMAMLEGKATGGELTKSWTASYLGNLVGSVAFAYLVFLGGTLASGGASVPVSMAKTSLTFTQAFVRGILCNWLVCMAVYLQSFAKDVAGKMVAIWFCISAFVALGLEHSVANMFIIPLGIFSGAAVSWPAMFLKNILPVTLGNIVGGAVLVAAAFSAIYGKKEH